MEKLNRIILKVTSSLPSPSSMLKLTNVEVAETSYQMLKVLLLCDRERVQPPSLKVTVLTFQVKIGKMEVSGESIAIF